MFRKGKKQDGFKLVEPEWGTIRTDARDQFFAEMFTRISSHGACYVCHVEVVQTIQWAYETDLIPHALDFFLFCEWLDFGKT